MEYDPVAGESETGQRAGKRLKKEEGATGEMAETEIRPLTMEGRPVEETGTPLAWKEEGHTTRVGVMKAGEERAGETFDWRHAGLFLSAPHTT